MALKKCHHRATHGTILMVLRLHRTFHVMACIACCMPLFQASANSEHTHAHINLFFIVFITATIVIVAICYYYRTTHTIVCHSAVCLYAVRAFFFLFFSLSFAVVVSFSTIKKWNVELLNRAENDDEKQRRIQAEIIFNLASHRVSL